MWFTTIERLSVAKAARATAVPKSLWDFSLPEITLEGLRRRNAFLDAIFYDISVVEKDEAVSVSPWLAAEGAMLVVPPRDNGALKIFSSVDALALQYGGSIRTLAVAGVGSSALGSAAFARNIADAIDEPVIAVVSGYGLADLAAEALGGYYWFGGLNAVRHAFEGLDRQRESGRVEEPLTQTTDFSLFQLSRDVRSIIALLQHESLQIELLTGHSKGNLVISEALYELRRRDKTTLQQIGANATIVTMSAKVCMPVDCIKVVDVVGSLDNLGILNSRPDISTDYTVPNAWHHTNTELPMHLPVTETIRELQKANLINIS